MPEWVELALTIAAMPLSVAIGALVVALLALVRGRNRAAAGWLAGGIVWLWVWSSPAFVHRLTAFLIPEHRLVAIDELPRADAIVVLLSTVGRPDKARTWPMARTTADSLRHGARLYAAAKAPIVFVAGTTWPPEPGMPTGADIMQRLLTTLGVPAAAIVPEGRSRSTRENALFVARLAAERDVDSVLLVTRGRHMARALGAFRQAGLKTFPAPVGAVTGYQEATVGQYLPAAGALVAAGRTLREWLALKSYQWRGWA